MSDSGTEVKLQNRDMKFVFDLHQKMLQKKFILIYEGEFTQEVTIVLLSLTERKIELSGEENNIRRKIFGIMVECLQNISKHAAKSTSPGILNSSIFSIGKDKEWYYISSGNLIRNVDIESLKNRIKKINNSTYEELKEFHFNVLTMNKLDEKGNSGLGLIDIAKKSREKLLIDFTSVNDEFSFYSFQARVRSQMNQ